MLKVMVAATAVLAIAGSSAVFAQQHLGGPYGSDGYRRFEQQYRPSADDIKAFTDARIAALKAGLALTPDQEKNWPPFEQGLRDVANLHLQRVQAREAGSEQQPTDPFARLQRRADAMSQFGAALKHVADTGAPLYQSLSDAQKHRFIFLAHILWPHWQEQRGHGMMGRDWDEGGMHGMMGPETDHGGRGMMGRDRDEGGMHGMMGAETDHGGRGMMGRDRDEGGMHGIMGPETGHDGRGMMGPESDEDSDEL